MSSSARISPLIRNPRTQYPLGAIEYGIEILTLLASLRFATVHQIQRVVFSRDVATERQARHRVTRSVRRLFDGGYLRRVVVFAPSASSGVLSRQIVHVLSAQGAGAVGVDPRWVRTRSPKDHQVLSHDYWLVELAVLMMEGCPEGLAIPTWWDDRVLSGRKRHGLLSLPNIPDGLLVVENLATGKPYPFLVELDLGSESVAARDRLRRDFSRKIEGYLGYLGAPFRQEFGIPAPAVVLIVAGSERRMQSLRRATQALGGGGRFWFTTLPRLRGQGSVDSVETFHSTARQGPFWAANWQTAADDEWRSVAARCGV